MKESYTKWIWRLLTSYLLVMTINIASHYKNKNVLIFWSENVEKTKWHLLCLAVLLGILFLTLIQEWIKKSGRDCGNLEVLLLFFSSLAFCVSYLWKCDNYYYGLGATLFASIVAVYCFRKGGFKIFENISVRGSYLSIGVLLVIALVFVAGISIYRHYIYFTATYDFGIFYQMFYYMRKTLLPLTTCERSTLLSHFSVHFSPIYYVLLPVFALVPRAETLLILQAMLALGGIIPLVLICKNRGLSGLATINFSIVYLFSVSIIGPCFYDFHENCFLPIILMWLFYAIEKDKTVFMYVMMAATLLVKEDAALYIMCIALFCMFSLGKKRHGFLMFDISVIYFFVTTNLMKKLGEGVMTTKIYSNLMADADAGLLSVIKTVVMNPSYFITQCLNEEKLKFFLLMLIPLALMPLITKKISNYFLVLPFLLINLASSYVYAYDIGYQYVFGTTTCLIYCALINYDAISSQKKEIISIIMAVATICAFVSVLSSKLELYHIYKENQKWYETKDRYLSKIPEDASVAVTDSFVLSHICQRDEIYYLDETSVESDISADFVVISDSDDNWVSEVEAYIIEEGYEQKWRMDGELSVYVSPDYE